jgi:enoyl-CoA hydratase/carnithine racemase
MTNSPFPPTSCWHVAQDGHVATLTLNLPATHNRLTVTALHELRDLTAVFNDRPDIWLIILQGEGEHFSVGIDVSLIGQMVGQHELDMAKAVRDVQDCLDQFEQVRQPVIARIHGYCLGAGFLLTLCADFRVATNTAVFGFPEVKRSIGVIMGAQRVSHLAGTAAAKEMMMLGELFAAGQAERWGLLNQVVDDDETGEGLNTAVQTYVNQLLALPPRAVTLNKQIINQGYQLSRRDSQNLELEAQFELLLSPDFQEAIASFFEKRPPVYTGE